MKSKMKVVLVAFAVAVVGLITGCGGGGGVTAPASGNGASSSPVSTPSAPPSAPPSAGAPDGAALYAANCAGCHGALANSAKKGAVAAQIQVRMSAPPFASRVLTAAEIQAIADVLAVTPPPPPPPTTTVDGAALYVANCAGCHGALANSAKKGAVAAQIQVRMSAPPFASRVLSAAEIQAIADVLFVATPPPPPACGSCHAIPPASGKHAFHTSRNVACATCHGAGYSTTTVNSATHSNGVKNLTTTIGWNATSRSCSNSCHGNKLW